MESKTLSQKIQEESLAQKGRSENTSGDEPIGTNIGRRGGLNLGQIPPLPDIREDDNLDDVNVYIDGNDNMEFGY